MKKLLTKMLAIASAIAVSMTANTWKALKTKADKMPDFSYLGAVGTLTEVQTTVVAESFYVAFQNHSTVAEFDFQNEADKIDMSIEAMESVQMIYDTLTHEYDTGILAVKKMIQCGVESSIDNFSNYLGSAGFSYYVSDEEYDSIFTELMGQLDEISALVLDEWSDVEKALFLHDYLAYHYDFDNTVYATSAQNLLRHTAYGMLSRKMAVCEGYASLYSMLLNREGILSRMMVSDSMGHAWNLVRIGEEWFHVDVTWDDCYDTHIGAVKHDSFLKDTQSMKKSGHTSDDWRTFTATTESNFLFSSRYVDGFWSTSNAVIFYDNGEWFAVTPKEEYPYTAEYSWYHYDAETNSAEKRFLFSDTNYWNVVTSDNPNEVYVGNFSIPAFYQGYLFYSTPTSVFCYDGNQIEWVMNLSDLEKCYGNIYAIHIEGDTLYYDIAMSPRKECVTHSMNISNIVSVPLTTSTESTPIVTETTLITTEIIAETTATSTELPITTMETTTSEETTTSATTSTTTTEATTTVETTTETTETTTTESTTTEAITETTISETSVTENTTEATTTEWIETESPTETTTESMDLVLYGDIDGDEELSISDIVLLQRYLHSANNFTETQFLLADMNSDGAVNVIDLALAKYQLLH